MDPQFLGKLGHSRPVIRAYYESEKLFFCEALVPAWRKDNAILVHDLYDAYTKHLDTGHHPKYYLNRFLAHPDKRRGDHFDWSAIINRMDPPLQSIFKALPMDENCLPALVYFKKYIE